MPDETPRKLMIFAWTGFCPDYTDGLAVAVAYDESQARQLVAEDYGMDPYNWGKLNVYPLGPQAFCVSGGG